MTTNKNAAQFRANTFYIAEKAIKVGLPVTGLIGFAAMCLISCTDGNKPAPVAPVVTTVTKTVTPPTVTVTAPPPVVPAPVAPASQAPVNVPNVNVPNVGKYVPNHPGRAAKRAVCGKFNPFC